MLTAEPDDVVERAAGLRGKVEALVPTLAERAEACEKARQVLPETIADLNAAGLHRLYQPRRFGGHELALDLAVDIITVLARGCASTAWVAAIYCDHQILIGQFADEASDDVWADDSDRLVSAGFVPSGSPEPIDGG